MINTLLLLGFLIVSIYLENRFIGRSRIVTTPDPVNRIHVYEMAEAPYNSINNLSFVPHELKVNSEKIKVKS